MVSTATFVSLKPIRITLVATNTTLHVRNTQLVSSALADHTPAVMWQWRSRLTQPRKKKQKISPTTQTHNKSCNMHFLNDTQLLRCYTLHTTRGVFYSNFSRRLKNHLCLDGFPDTTHHCVGKAQKCWYSPIFFDILTFTQRVVTH